ncbi:hypothetical protein ACHAL6_03965 [Proteiniclasticum sp. C24MP]|uniref:hypothetical protein n=1 Tax=Proteiniclasticum sp. C24MP TaxID=3374101 RepID=UPI00375459BD
MRDKAYMTEVESLLEKLTEKEKDTLILSLARRQEEKYEKAFLKLMGKKEISPLPILMNQDEVMSFLKWLGEVNQGILYLECSYDETDEDYPWDTGYEILYRDKEGIGSRMKEGVLLAEKLLQGKYYEEALALYDATLGTAVTAIEEESGECMEMSFSDLVDEEIIQVDEAFFTLSRLLAVYDCKEKRERAEDFYEMLSQPRAHKLKLRDFWSVTSEELKGRETFLQEWIDFLSEISGDRAEELLYEAAHELGGVEKVTGLAGALKDIHPRLYLRSVELYMEEEKENEALAIGWKALEEIPGSLVIRAEICDRMIQLALNMSDSEAVHRLMKLAFSSDSTLPRYLKLFQLPAFREVITAASEEIGLLPKRLYSAERSFSRELTTNSISDHERDVIYFFSGSFHETFEKCKADSTSLGWSSSLKGVVVPLLILVLNKEEAQTEPADMLWKETLMKLEYGFSEEILLQDFMNWKQVMVEEIRELEDYMDWVRDETDKRVDAVVGGGFRQSYHKAALLITNLGEMLESRGYTGSRIELAERYRNRYKRHRAFKEELNALGL